MTPPPEQREPRIDDVLLTAAGLEGVERDAYLKGIAATRPSLAELVRQQVEQSESVEDSFLDKPAADRLGSVEATSPLQEFRSLPLEERYEVGACLGEGGMGRVMLAQDHQLGRQVAMKFLHQTEPGIARLLLREARLQARVQHEHVLEIYDSGLLADGPFIAMRYVAGGTLADFGAKLSLDRKVRLLVQTAEGLHAAHRIGLLHRDVKPSNVLVEESIDGDLCARVTDFGLATDESQSFQERNQGGTPQYVAPETLLKEISATDRRSDIYSLGATMYRFLTGAAPLEGAHTMAILRSAIAGSVQPPRKHAPQLPAEIEAIILHCMERSPDDRYSSARAVAEDLQRYMNGEVVEAYSAGLAYRLTRFVLRNRMLMAVAGAALLTLVVAMVMVAVFALRTDQARQQAEVRKKQAEGLIGFMVGDLREKLEPLGRLEILEEVGDRAMVYFDQVEQSELSPEERSRYALTFRQIGQVRRLEGDLVGAAAAFRSSLELTQSLAKAAPSDSRLQVELCAALFWVGQALYDQGDFEPALPYMQRYLKIAETWARRFPEDETWRLELTQATSNVGSVLERMGDVASALSAYRRRLAFAQDLVQASPDNTALQLERALAHNTLGFALESVGELTEALAHYEQDLAIKQALVDSDPSHQLWRQRLATSVFYLANLHRQSGRLTEAESQFRAQLEISKTLAKMDQRNGEWQRNEAVAKRGLAQVLAWQGSPEAALDLLRSADRTFQALTDSQPEQTEWRLQLARTRGELGRVLEGMGKLEAAEQAARSTLDVLESLDSSATEQQVEAMLLQGTVEQALGGTVEARRSWLRALEQIEPKAPGPTKTQQLALWTRCLLLLGRHQAAEEPLAWLDRAGYRHPEIEKLR